VFTLFTCAEIGERERVDVRMWNYCTTGAVSVTRSTAGKQRGSQLQQCYLDAHLYSHTHTCIHPYEYRPADRARVHVVILVGLS
jgi:hypothetical protein